MTITTTPTTNGPAPETSVLSALRALLPMRQLQLGEALRVAELQAERLRQLRGCVDVPVPTDIISGLPRLIIEHDDDLPRRAASGVSYWHKQKRSWVIGLNPDEPRTRRRFSALHEFLHIVWHYHPGVQPSARRPAGLDPVEFVADYFAGAVLVPKRLLRAAYYDGIQRVSDLAELFDVSKRAIEVRLAQVGLVDPTDDHATGPRYRLQRPQTPLGAPR